MPTQNTEITEVATALGMLGQELPHLLKDPPPEVVNVPLSTWDRLRAEHASGTNAAAFMSAFENGRAFLASRDGLRGRRPLRAEWKGPHRAPGDDVVPADLRIDHVYLVSCKYLSRVLSNSGPARLFDRLLAGEDRATDNWFANTAPAEFESLYRAAADASGITAMPLSASELTRTQQRQLRDTLRQRTWPEPLRRPWEELCAAVATASAERWRAAMARPRDRLRLLWRLLRITTATYFVLGADRADHLRLRVDSAWDWGRAYELRRLVVTPRLAGQPIVDWRAIVRHRSTGDDSEVLGHVEIRWSHGRFNGSPEAKVYLDMPHHLVPGYHPIS